ncbi:MAG: SBBP repeat-containing protein [Bryobacteraceae bacterium]|nr:SBBP repeat-containing protein [Bryobacteraceae bacterium]
MRHFARIRYRDVYPGVDLVYYGAGGKLEYDVVLSAGAAKRQIEVAFEGAKRISTNANGDLDIVAGGATIRQLRPRVYQTMGGVRKPVEASYRVTASNRVQFALGKFDRSREVVIDPVIQYATYVGRSGQESVSGVAVDAAGNAYISGDTTSIDLSTGTVFQNSRAGDNDAFVAKVASNGTLIFISYLGGKAPDSALAIAADDSGNVFLCGVTFSADFPVKNAFREQFAGGQFDSFVAKLTSNGSQLTWATYLGGNGEEWADAIASDGSGGAWISGWTTSANFPLRKPFQGGPAGGGGDIFVSRINSSGLDLSYSTYVGGEGQDLAAGIAADDRGNVYVTGSTTSKFFPFVAAVQDKQGGLQDMFVFHLDTEKNDIVFATLLGGSGNDVGTRVAIDNAGYAYVTGYTQSPDFPVTRGAAQTTSRGMTEVFVAKIGRSRLAYSTLLGGNGEDWAGGIAVDAAGSAYVVGWTNSGNFPVRNGFQSAYLGGNASNQRYDATVTRISPGGDAVLYSSYLGGTGEDKAYGVALDRSGNVLVAGSTTSADFPSAVNAFGSATPGLYDGFVVRLSADSSVNFIGSTPSEVIVTARSSDTQIAPVTVALSGTAGATAFSAGSMVPWLKVSPESGTTPATLIVTVDPLQLTVGANTAEIVVQTGQNVLRIPVTINLTLAATITAITPGILVRGSSDVVISVTGGGFSPAAIVEINRAAVAARYIDSRTLSVTVPASLIVSEGTLSVVVSNPEGRSNTFSLQVASGGAVFAPSGVLNAASGLSGAIAPGELLDIRGTGFGADSPVTAVPADGFYSGVLAATRILFDGVSGPILFTASGRVHAVVPYSVAGRSSAQIVIESAGRQSAGVTVAVQAAAPALFTADSSGRGQAAAVNENGSGNSASNPAARGSVLVMYGTGQGLPSTQLTDGVIVNNAIRPILPVTVLIGGIPAVVEYAGSAPGLVAGVLQLNVRVPDLVAPGNSVPIVVFAGGFASPSSGVTVAVR